MLVAKNVCPNDAKCTCPGTNAEATGLGEYGRPRRNLNQQSPSQTLAVDPRQSRFSRTAKRNAASITNGGRHAIILTGSTAIEV